MDRLRVFRWLPMFGTTSMRTFLVAGEGGGASTGSGRGAATLAMERSQLPPAHTLDAEARFLDREAGAEKLETEVMKPAGG